jgi:pyruvate/oxaloacetate carboxyltransferase
MFYRELLHRQGIAMTPKRMVEICLNTSRDGQQSFIGARLRGIFQQIIIRLQAVLGIRIMETWGGLVNQTSAWERVRKEDPEDMWHNLREQTLILREELYAVLKDYEPVPGNRKRIRKKDWDLLFDRYELKEDRKLLSDKDLSDLLNRNPCLKPIQNKIIRQYGLKQEMLLRGQYLVGLKSYPLEIQKLFVRVAYKNGMDVFRIFDAENDVRNILPVLEAAKAVGARIQPVLHYTTDFPLELQEYVRIADMLVSASGDSLDSLVLKDAGGLLDDDAAFDYVKGLRTHFNELALRIPFQIHTHDTRGNRLLTLLEAIRANGSDDPITVDLGVGKFLLSGSVGQPDLRDFLAMTDDTSWAPAYPINREKMAELEYKIEHEIMTENGKPRFKMPNLTSAVRRLLVEVARIPGGAFTSFYDVFLHNVSLCASKLESLYKIKLVSTTGKEFTPEWALEALLIAVLWITRAVTNDLGGVSLVTPTAHWIYSQAAIILSELIKLGWMTITKKGDGANLSVTIGSSLIPEAPTDRGLQYTKMTPEIQNYLLIWSQDAERQRLYPKVNREVVLQAYRMLNDLEVNLTLVEAALQSEKVDVAAIKRVLRKYENVRKVTGTKELAEKPFVDLAIVKLTQRWYSNHEVAPTREDLLSILQGENIPQTTDELRKSYAKIRARFPRGAKDSDEDFLTWVIFPEADQSLHLFATAEKELIAQEKFYIRTGRKFDGHRMKVAA